MNATQCLRLDDFFFDRDFLGVWSELGVEGGSGVTLGVTSLVSGPEEGVSGTS